MRNIQLNTTTQQRRRLVLSCVAGLLCALTLGWLLTSRTTHTALAAGKSAQAANGACTMAGGMLTGGNLFTAASNGTFGTGTGAPGASAGALPAGVIPGYAYVDYNLGNTFNHPVDGEYTVVNNPNAALYGNWYQPKGHTTGLDNDNFVMINAAGTPDIFFEETVSGLQPNTNYEFSIFGGSLNSVPALEASVSFETVDVFGTVPRLAPTAFPIHMPQFVWEQRSFVFNTGPSTTITFRLRNNTFGNYGNDFAMDDVTVQQCVNLATGTVTGRVYSDDDRDNMPGGGEAGIPNIEVRLIDQSTGAVTGITDSGAGGVYNFSNILVGNYTVRVKTNDPDLPLSATLGTPNDLTAAVTNGGMATANFGFDLPGADLAVLKTGPPSVVAGGTISYAILVSNAGPSGASNAVVTDNVSASLSNVTFSCGNPTGGAVCGAGASGSGNAINAVLTSLPANSSVTLTVTGTVAGAAANTTLTNMACVAGLVPDTNTNNNCSTAGPVPVLCPALTVTPTNSILPAGMTGVAYSQALTQSGAFGNSASFSITSGALPAGLTLSPTGLLTGTPAALGNFSFTVTASDALTCSGARAYTLQITCGPVTLNPNPLPAAQAGSAYSQMLTASGGVAPYAFAITGGGLPPGVSLSSGGLLSGTPTASGAFNVTITATGTGGCAGSRTYSFTVACPAITLTTPPFPDGAAGIAYNYTVTATPAGNYTFTLSQGNLPSGLTLSLAGVVSGLPHVVGVYNFAIRATNMTTNTCGGEQAYRLTINCPAISVSALPAPALNTFYNQTVTATPAGGNYSYAVTSGALPPGLTLNAATGTVSGITAVTGSYNFTLTATGWGACTGARAYAFVLSGCPTISLPALPNGAPYQLYNNSVAASPTAGYSYVMTAGSLPPGVTFYSQAALLYGYPTAAGTYSFTLRATDGNNCTGQREYRVTIGSRVVARAQQADYDGDGQSDAVLWSASTGRWNILRSSDQQSLTPGWGTAGDLALLGDYDGDGQTDLAVFRPANGTWYVKRSSDGSALVNAWGAFGDVPVPGDYDGDGKTDCAVFRPSDGNWYVLRSSDQQYTVTAWGAGYAPYDDVAVPGDYDGDGKTDLAVFRRATGTWLVKRSSDGQFSGKQWGVGTDVPVAADYDGDGKTDFAIWRTGTWYIWQSASNNYRVTAWGANAAPYFDQAVPGDYDGDGQVDVAVWRAADQTWYIRS
ncbi:MAG: putative Ig domain-containing protein [Acidobacteria bacterium]|nr:putative Ig domain-containing protein [Acidobacteriota bacterium]